VRFKPLADDLIIPAIGFGWSGYLFSRRLC